MFIPVKLASELTGISKSAILILSRVGLVDRVGNNRSLKVDLDGLVTVDDVAREVAEELSSEGWHLQSKRAIARAFIYRLARKRGLIPINKIKELFGLTRQNALNAAKRNCTVRKILNRYFVVPDEKWEAFIQRRLELARRREELEAERQLARLKQGRKSMKGLRSR